MDQPVTLDRAQSSHRHRRWTLVGGGLLAAALFLLNFADRAPGYTIDHAGEVRAYGSNVERVTGIDIVDRSDVPFAIDTISHFVLWFLVGLMVYAVFAGRRLPAVLGRRRIGAPALLLGVVFLAGFFEYAQSLFTTTRNLELGDALANLIGGVVGLLAALIVSAGLRWMRSLRRGVTAARA